MLRQSRLLSIVSLTAAVTAAHAVDLDFIGTFNGRSFYVSKGFYTASDAANLASSIGGNLASLHGIAETNWLLDPSRAGSSDLFWIGLSDRVTEGTFLWDDNTSLDFTNWHAGEPNQAGEEDNVVFNWGTPGEWNDWNEGNSARALVSVAAPGPAAAVPFLVAGLASLRRRRKA